MNIDHLDPKIIWKNFYSLTQIPRPSKKESKAVLFLEKFGKEHGLETLKDEVGNVIIRKPATKGMENRKGIILQGHVDMVPQNNNDVNHNWETDPITPRIVDNDWLYATGTTLGADNGLGCAVALSVLESKDLVHGPIEALFTIDEETGMTGARALKSGLLHGDILINLDSETEGELYVGCAGGLDATAEFKYTTSAMPAGFEPFEVTVKGLRGGHSGMEINEGRANSNKILARILLPLLRDLGAKLISIEGGNLRNAIPREAVAKVALPKEKVAKAKATLKKIAAAAKSEYALIDPGMEIFMKPCKGAKVIDDEVALRAMKAVYVCPCGIDRMSLAIKDLVETSNNLAIVKSGNGKIVVKTLMRGSIDSAKEELRDKIRATFELAGAKIAFSGGYSGWQPNMDSPILHAMKDTYKRLFGKEADVKAIHAGLECGILAGAYPHWDMISCGPTICSPHSPDERVFIPSVAKWWQFVTETLKNAPVK